MADLDMNEIDYNFKTFLVVLTDDEMKNKIKDYFSKQDIEVAYKFTTSYLDAAKLYNKGRTNIYDGVILNLSFSNKKLFEFVEYIKPQVISNELILLEYQVSGEILRVSLT